MAPHDVIVDHLHTVIHNYKQISAKTLYWNKGLSCCGWKKWTWCRMSVQMFHMEALTIITFFSTYKSTCLKIKIGTSHPTRKEHHLPDACTFLCCRLSRLFLFSSPFFSCDIVAYYSFSFCLLRSLGSSLSGASFGTPGAWLQQVTLQFTTHKWPCRKRVPLVLVFVTSTRGVLLLIDLDCWSIT
jgi:hypothetical protein